MATGKLGTQTVLKSRAPNYLRAGEIEASRKTVLVLGSLIMELTMMLRTPEYEHSERVRVVPPTQV